MLNSGVIRPSDSEFVSPVKVAPKEDNSWIFCTVYRRLNQQTDLFPFFLTIMDYIISETGGCEVFSRIDLSKGFWQIRLREEDKKFTAFVTPFGLYEYNVLPFGWKNSPPWFQKIMTSILDPYLGKFCTVYVDDILIISRNKEDHQEHLQLVLEVIRKA